MLSNHLKTETYRLVLGEGEAFKETLQVIESHVGHPFLLELKFELWFRSESVGVPCGCG